MKPNDTSKHLQGITDLTLVAPIKPGLIDAMDTRTYETRLKLLMRTLSSLRASSREFSEVRLFSDAVERIQSIHSFRVAILEPGKKLLLAVTFDRGWEPYIRLIWRDLGTLLDVIFCNCVGYPIAFESSFDDYVAWIRAHQVDTHFFYTATGLSVTDLQYLRQVEQIQRGNRDVTAADDEATRSVAADPAQAARREAGKQENLDELKKTSLRALAALYRLTELYPADRPDGAYLWRAAREILRELREIGTENLFPKKPQPAPERWRFGEQLAWFEDGGQAPSAPVPSPPNYNKAKVQGGIVEPYPADVTHGCLVLMSVTDPDRARAFVAGFPVTTEADAQTGCGPYINIAFTYGGLRRLGLDDQELDGFPKEFREGMEARAGLLGDVRAHHPRNWTLPERNWPPGNPVGATAARVELAAVDIVVQLRAASPSTDYDVVKHPQHPLRQRVEQLANAPGVKVLSVQSMRRYLDTQANMPREHFGFIDGISQPAIGPAGKTAWNNNVPLGELLRGYENADYDPPLANPLLDDGSFLVVRKLRQDIDAFNALIAAHSGPHLPPDELKGRLIGRTPDGDPLAKRGHPLDNDFDYSNDKEGRFCPFQAHVRRANPRTLENQRVPRLARRGMSYGPRYEAEPGAERGLVFMAYNASIAEQFEVIQRWLNGGNSTGVFSAQSDPILGVRQAGEPRTFRFIYNGAVQRVNLDAPTTRPAVQFEWGVYLFAPAPAALKLIGKAPAHGAPPGIDGEPIVQALLGLEAQGAPREQVIAAWKAHLEDFESKLSGVTAAIWRAIRENHGGVLRTDYGVLVGGADQVMDVFKNRQGWYSVGGYHERMLTTIGGNYLGLDEGQQYRDESTGPNAKMMSIGMEAAFHEARGEAQKFFNFTIGANGEGSFDTRELSDEVLANLSATWFGLPDGIFVKHGGWSWTESAKRSPRCPGDFTSPSRYMFSPHPADGPKRYAQMHGQSLHAAAFNFVRQYRSSNSVPAADITAGFFNAIPDDDDRLARTIVGAMMGFLPTVDGSLRSVLYDWMADGTLWRLQELLLTTPLPQDPQPSDVYHRAQVLLDPLRRAMKRRPVPDIVWRRAVHEHDLGSVRVREGEPIVVGVISATQEQLANDDVQVFAVFGGDRKGDPGHPQHACPAYEIAIGVLLGTLTGLLEAGTLRPTPSPTGLIVITPPATQLQALATAAQRRRAYDSEI